MKHSVGRYNLLTLTKSKSNKSYKCTHRGLLYLFFFFTFTYLLIYLNSIFSHHQLVPLSSPPLHNHHTCSSPWVLFPLCSIPPPQLSSSTSFTRQGVSFSFSVWELMNFPCSWFRLLHNVYRFMNVDILLSFPSLHWKTRASSCPKPSQIP